MIVGLDAYLDQVADLLRPGTRVLASGLGAERERRRGGRRRLSRAGGRAHRVRRRRHLRDGQPRAGAGRRHDIDVIVVPGVTAALAAAALLGAPLGHDHA